MHYGCFWQSLCDTTANMTLARNTFALFIQSEDDKQNQQQFKKKELYITWVKSLFT